MQHHRKPNYEAFLEQCHILFSPIWLTWDFKQNCAISKNFPKLTKPVLASADQKSSGWNECAKKSSNLFKTIKLAWLIFSKEAKIKLLWNSCSVSSNNRRLLLEEMRTFARDFWSKEQPFKDWLNLRNTLFPFKT